MIFLMTKDSFLLQGFWQLKDNHEMIKINSLSEIKKVGNKPFKVIIDTYHNHILDEEAIKFLEKLDAERIIVLAPYHISKLKAKAPIYFVSRKESIKNLLLRLLMVNTCPIRIHNYVFHIISSKLCN